MSDREIGNHHVAMEIEPGLIQVGLHTRNGYNCSLTTPLKNADSTYYRNMTNYVINTSGAELNFAEVDNGMHKIIFTATDYEVLRNLEKTIKKNSPNISVSGLDGRYEGVSHTANPSVELKYHSKIAEVEKGKDITYTLTR